MEELIKSAILNKPNSSISEISLKVLGSSDNSSRNKVRQCLIRLRNKIRLNKVKLPRETFYRYSIDTSVPEPESELRKSLLKIQKPGFYWYYMED